MKTMIGQYRLNLLPPTDPVETTKSCAKCKHLIDMRGDQEFVAAMHILLGCPFAPNIADIGDDDPDDYYCDNYESAGGTE